MKVYIDGSFYTREEAKISVFDHGLLYGDGIFEGLRIYYGRIFELEAHLDRLFDSAHALNLKIPLSKKELSEALYKTLEENQRRDGYIRLVVTRGIGDLGLNPKLCPKATVIIIADDISLYPKQYYDEGIAVITSSVRRIPSQCLDPRIKSLNYLNNIMAKLEAHQAGCLEAVMLNLQGNLAECTADNIFMVKNGILKTPALNQGALGGITRGVILKIAEESNLPFEEGTYTTFDLYTAEEVFLTGSGAEIIPVTKADGRTIGQGKPGPITLTLRQNFQDYTSRILPLVNPA